MSASDFAAILSQITAGFHGQQMPHVQANMVLAAKVPELCRTCEGTALDYSGNVNHPTPCTDCPTIGQLLAIGAAVMSATLESPKGSGPQGVLIDGKYLAQFAVQTIACLRAVQP